MYVCSGSMMCLSSQCSFNFTTLCNWLYSPIICSVRVLQSIENFDYASCDLNLIKNLSSVRTSSQCPPFNAIFSSDVIFNCQLIILPHPHYPVLGVSCRITLLYCVQFKLTSYFLIHFMWSWVRDTHKLMPEPLSCVKANLLKNVNCMNLVFNPISYTINGWYWPYKITSTALRQATFLNTNIYGWSFHSVALNILYSPL